MGVIFFNNISCEDYGIVVEHYPEYQTPSRDYDMVHVPGRNGDVAIDQGSFQNVDRVYQIAVGSYEKRYTEQVNAIAEWLHGPAGYAKLEDSYEPEYYRMAVCTDGFEAENMKHMLARTTITFNCKPQRWLKSGDTPISIGSGSQIIKNPTRFTSSPIIKITCTGNGSFTIQNKNTYTVTLNNVPGGGIIIDSDIMDAYSLSTPRENRNSCVTLSNGFPRLTPGDNTITASAGINTMEVIPKWWTV